jgi:hypothetical protein
VTMDEPQRGDGDTDSGTSLSAGAPSPRQFDVNQAPRRRSGSCGAPLKSGKGTCRGSSSRRWALFHAQRIEGGACHRAGRSRRRGEGTARWWIDTGAIDAVELKTSAARSACWRPRRKRWRRERSAARPQPPSRSSFASPRHRRGRPRPRHRRAAQEGRRPGDRRRAAPAADRHSEQW